MSPEPIRTKPRAKKYPGVNPAVQAHNALIVAKQAQLVEVCYPNCRQAYTYWAPVAVGLAEGHQVLVRATGEFIVGKVQRVHPSNERCLGLPYALSPVLMRVDSRGHNMHDRFHAAAAQRVLAGDFRSTVEREAGRLLAEAS